MLRSFGRFWRRGREDIRMLTGRFEGAGDGNPSRSPGTTYLSQGPVVLQVM
jgi:hypothetical protein